MDMYGQKSPSRPQKIMIVAIELLLIAASYFVLFGPLLSSLRAFDAAPSMCQSSTGICASATARRSPTTRGAPGGSSRSCSDPSRASVQIRRLPWVAEAQLPVVRQDGRQRLDEVDEVRVRGLQLLDDGAELQVIEPQPRRFMHHLELYDVGDVDEEVRAWLQEAWANAA